MAQGKNKVSCSMNRYANIEVVKQGKNKKKQATNRRKNAPIQQKKTKSQEAQKLKKMITKTVNSTMEDELRDKALDGKKSLVKPKKPSTLQKQ